MVTHPQRMPLIRIVFPAVSLLALAACGAESAGTTEPPITSTRAPVAAEPDPAQVAEVRTAADVTDRVAAAVASVNPDKYTNLTYRAAGSVLQPDLMGWQIRHLRLDPVFSDCREGVGQRVVCSLTYGEEYFYSVVIGHNMPGSVTVDVWDDGSFTIIEWPFPEEIKTAERELREWIRATHPEVESEMFGTDAYGMFKFTERALQLHADYLDEYVASRDA